ncbi:MAG: hypothetical protein CVU61_15745 [Deltaproteobacteria bacterium HGW-Deltaproteobacteria-19]|nr:MAG: hypothetical protein CVU61_15745 [Deltaproteobacteria bacterium HGW-Deltaproteobacteria-19]
MKRTEEQHKKAAVRERFISSPAWRVVQWAIGYRGNTTLIAVSSCQKPVTMMVGLPGEMTVQVVPARLADLYPV